MGIADKIYIENYYVNNPLKFYTNPRGLRIFFIACTEIAKFALAKLGMLKWAFNERVVERPFVFQNLPEKLNARILDIGCADSIMPIEMASLGYETYGNDYKKYPFTHPRFKFILGDALKLPFRDNFFDAVTCISVIEHVGLSKDFGQATRERKDKMLMEKVHKMLKKKGILILTTSFGTSRILGNKHTRVYNFEECKMLFSGFKKIKERYFYYAEKLQAWQEASPDILEKITKDKNKDTVAMFVLEKS